MLYQFLPLFVFSAYNLITYLLFLYGPINWRPGDPTVMNSFLLASMLLYIAGYLFGSRLGLGRRVSFDFISKNLFSILVVGVVTFALSIYIYTGSYFWNTAKLMADQQQNYADMLSYANSSSKIIRAPFVFFKIVFQPLLTIAVIYATINFSRLSFFQKLALAAVYLFWSMFSIFRGTDKEIFDIIIIVLSCAAIGYFRKNASAREITAKKFAQLILIQVAFISVVASFLVLFSERKANRMLGNTRVCVEEIYVCSKLDTDKSKFNYGYAMASTYISQGYYGLHLALKQPFDSTYLLGGTPGLAPLATGLFGPDFLNRTYPLKIEKYGWDSKIRWATAYTWWASDISFWLVPFVLFVMGAATALAWREAIIQESLLATAVFSTLTTGTIFLSANNQIGITIDSLSAFLAISVAWLITRRYRLELKRH